MTETIIFTFSDEYCESNEIIDYYCDVNDDDEEITLNIHVEDVDSDLLSMSDEDLCEHFGMNSEFLLYTNR